jgi:hypothetical protein
MNHAWCFLARLFGHEAAGQLALTPCLGGLGVRHAAYMSESMDSDMTRMRWLKRPSRRRPMLPGGKRSS